MTEEQIALARRAVACRGWRWMPGMLTSHGARYLGFDLWVDRGQRVAVFADPDEGEVPDLTDPATLGCLLALVREAQHEPTYLPTCLDADDEAWVIEAPSQERQTRYGSYASALVAALEAA